MTPNSDFQVVTLQYSKESTSHNLFVKEQRLTGEITQKSLFVANLPPYIDQEVLKNTCGNQITSIQLIPNQTVGIGFKNASLLCKNKSKVFTSSIFSCELPVSGFQQWRNGYNNSKPDLKNLSKEINKYALQFRQEEKKRKNSENKDDEGWTVVKKKGSKSTDVTQKNLKLKAKKKDTKNFYAFQIRDNNLKKLSDLRTSYEDAKKRVELIKSSRKFKPY